MNIICFNQNDQKLLAIIFNENKVEKIEKRNDFSIGYDAESNLVFINIFNPTFNEKYDYGLIYPTKEFLEELTNFTGLYLNNYINHSKIIVAKIVSLEPIPNTHLNYCDVQINQEKVIKIVCGAKNAREGLLTVAALDKTLIPTGIFIKKGKLMNLDSNGMLCSAKELKLENESSGIIELDNGKYNIGDIFKDVYVNLK